MVCRFGPKFPDRRQRFRKAAIFLNQFFNLYKFAKFIWQLSDIFIYTKYYEMGFQKFCIYFFQFLKILKNVLYTLVKLKHFGKCI